MDIFDINYALEHITVLVDTREQKTPALKERLKSIGYPHERIKLSFGDYSARCQLPNQTAYDFSESVAIERKMSLDELASCFCSNGRERFKKEFERAKVANAKMYLLIENGSWEKIYSGEYRSMMHSKAFVASVQAWLARYDCQILFCSPEISGKLIADILRREIKERLENDAQDVLCG